MLTKVIYWTDVNNAALDSHGKDPLGKLTQGFFRCDLLIFVRLPLSVRERLLAGQPAGNKAVPHLKDREVAKTGSPGGTLSYCIRRLWLYVGQLCLAPVAGASAFRSLHT